MEILPESINALSHALDALDFYAAIPAHKQPHQYVRDLQGKLIVIKRELYDIYHGNQDFLNE